MRELFVVLLVATLLFPQPTVAQSFESVEVRVVNVDVTVTDRDGNPVTGLTRDDFEVLEDGKPQPITHFYAVTGAAPAPVATAASPAPATPVAEPQPERFRRRILVLIDGANTSMHARDEAIRKLREYIDANHDGKAEWAVATVENRTRLLLPLTSDKARLSAALDSLARGRGVTANVQAQTDDHVDRGAVAERRSSTLNDAQTADKVLQKEYFLNAAATEESLQGRHSVVAIAQAARAFANVEGKKVILLVTGRLPLSQTSLGNVRQGSKKQDRVEKPTATSTVPAAEARTKYKDSSVTLQDRFSETADRNSSVNQLRDALVKEANASNTSFYILAAQGLEVGSIPMGDTAGSAQPDFSAMTWVANETGGQLLRGNRIDESLQKFDRASANFYSIGYTPKYAQDGKYHRIKVRMKKGSGYTLLHRDGYAAVPDGAQLERALQSYLGATMQPTSFPVALTVKPVQPHPKEKEASVLPLEVGMAMSSIQYIPNAAGAKGRVKFYISIFDEKDEFVTSGSYVQPIDLKPNEQPQGRMVIALPGIALRKGAYRVVVTARDEVGQTLGMAMENVKI